MAKSVQIKSVRPWHEQIVDWMLQNPHRTQGDCAAYFDKTQAWLSSIINSDLFREYKSLRFTQHQDMVSHSVIERVSGLAGLSLEVLHDRIHAERNDIPLGIVKDSAELTLKALGYGPKAVVVSSSATVNLNLNGASAPVLDEARDDLRRLHRDNAENVEDAIEVEETEDIAALAFEKVEERVNGSPTPDAPRQVERSPAPQLPLFGEP